MDDLIAFNKDRWEELVRAGVLYSRPWLDLTPDGARARIDPLGLLGNLARRRVLCLAGGGGQQSAALALLGAHVWVLDLTEGQLARDRQAAAHYGLPIATAQGDMRDLSRFPAAAFDAVYQPYSINFVPDPETVFRQVARVLRPGCLYRVGFHNPFTFEASEKDWDGRGYPLRRPYRDGEVTWDDPDWVIEREDGSTVRVAGPREFCHTLGTLINGLARAGFAVTGMEDGAMDDVGEDASAPPGSWEHYVAVMRPFLALWATRRP